MNYLLHLLVFFGIYSILALGLNVAVGYCGLLTLAQAAYFAIGAYGYAIATVGWGWSPWLGLLLAVASGGVLSCLVTLPTWRLRGDFFVIATLAVQILVQSTIHNWCVSGEPLGSLQNLTNGAFGIAGIPRSEPVALLDKLPSFAFFVLLITIGVVFLCRALFNSSWGLALKCVRDDELAARGIGQPAHVLKAQALLVASCFAALAGGLYAAYTSFISADLASVDESILLLSMVLVGGAGNLRGPIIGALVLLLIPELLRLLPISDSVASECRIMIYGLVLVLTVRFMPRGIAGAYKVS